MSAHGRSEGAPQLRTAQADASADARRRPCLRPCWACLALALVLAAVVASFAYLAVDWRQLFSGESMRLMAKFVRRVLSARSLARASSPRPRGARCRPSPSPRSAPCSRSSRRASLALPAAGRFGLAPRLAARLALNVLRSVPELVWAALMVLAAGLGPFAGTLALALHTTGVLGRLFAESLENAAARRRSGRCATPAAARSRPSPMRRCRWSRPQGVAYALYRWR